jgi:hypothetical protein
LERFIEAITLANPEISEISITENWEDTRG